MNWSSPRFLVERVARNPSQLSRQAVPGPRRPTHVWIAAHPAGGCGGLPTRQVRCGANCNWVDWT